MKKYDHKKIEAKWQKYWQTKKTFIAKDSDKRPKKYILDMFPYPSGAGLHVGHPEGYTATDILSRYARMKGFNVLHPMGWDAFGLPAENYAIKEGIHPQKTTQKNIKRFTAQIKSIGLSYDWSREVNTSDPEYYKWTQWLFLQLYKKGLAYKKLASVNWCPKDNTVLANEQVVDGKCERCGTEVVKKKLSQWFFKITEYADELLSELDNLDWPEPIKTMQRNWIGRSEGITWTQKVKDLDIPVECYDSVPQTFMAQTFCVIAPEHPLVQKLITGTEYEKPVSKFIEELEERKRIDKFKVENEIEGIFTGRYIENPFGTGDLPIWVASFVIADYGTGIVNSSAHDERDFTFAKKYNIPLRPVMFPKDPIEAQKVRNLEVCYHHEPEALMEQPQEFSGRKWGEAREDIIDYVIKKGYGYRTVNYKLRDWLLSRQRYWGAPIPIIYCEKCGPQPVPEKDLPVKLPTDVDFRPTGESPLKRSKKFKKVVCPNCKGKAERDYDTMDTFVDSSWYFLRYTDPKNKSKFADAKKITNWLPVDTYIGGAEHAVLHLLYARFFTKAMNDLKMVDFREPFIRLRNIGLILGPDGEKMSKSRGNVINPDDIVKEFGADSLRMFEMFMGPLEDAKPWMTAGIIGITRFLDRVWQSLPSSHLGGGILSAENDDTGLLKIISKANKKITEDIEGLRFNTAVSALMICLNDAKQHLLKFTVSKNVYNEFRLTYIKLLYPFAPHISEELYSLMGGKKSLQLEKWPEFDPSLVVDQTVEIVVQVNGKVKGKLTLPTGQSQDKAQAAAMELEPVKQAISGQSIKRTIYVPNRLINFVV